jgi:hydrogenase maturation factor
MTLSDPAAACSPGTPCITCSDQGIVMRVMSPSADGLAVCAGEDERAEEVEVSLLDAVLPGDLLLVHAGVALARLSGERGTS